ncbi:hypothetical protein Psta_2808 [Pirellula staleyi DSM 6068]|uniref:Uncharacterized protein n=1 Tax=Pirellula staleyi (strain ATCC 27377 / DSM 6068 / ICPB 4128) TaxID=530564 RepID=D2R7P8_PIRSD|nr:hypothetical protein Psta_2808 [Pirellula staleyi DSM 6068]
MTATTGSVENRFDNQGKLYSQLSEVYLLPFAVREEVLKKCSKLHQD